MAVEALASIEVANTKGALARQLNAAIDQVAAKLVNTRSVCRSSYIHPAVFEDFEAGQLLDIVRMKSKSERLLKWMDDDEILLLRWQQKRAPSEALPTGF